MFLVGVHLFALLALFGHLTFRLFRLLDVPKSRATTEINIENPSAERKGTTHSMPRSTSGMAVNMAMLFVTLPSSAALFSVFQRSDSSNSSLASRDAASDVSCWRRCILMLSSIYTILPRVNQRLNIRNAQEGAHMCLSTSSALVCWVKLLVRTARRAFAAASVISLYPTSRTVSAIQQHDGGAHASSALAPAPAPAPAPALAPARNPPLSSGTSSAFRRRFFLASPLDSLCTSIPCLALRNRLNSSSSESLCERKNERFSTNVRQRNTHGRDLSSSSSPSSLSGSETLAEGGSSVSGDFSRTRGCGRVRLLIMGTIV